MLRKSLLVVAGLVLLVLLLILLFGILLFITKGSFLKDTVADLASAQTGREVVIEGPFQLYPDPHIRLHAEGIRVSNPDWAEEPQLFQAELLDFRLDLWKLITGDLVFRRFTLDRGRAELERGEGDLRTWIFKQEPEPAEFQLPVIHDGSITATVIRYLDKAGDFDLTLRLGDIRADREGSGPLTITGNGRVRGAPFKIAGRLTDPQSFFESKPSKVALVIDAAESRAEIDGELPSLSSLEDADLNIRVKGKSLDTPFALIGVIVSPSRPYELSAKFQVEEKAWHFGNLAGRIGDSDIAGTLSIFWQDDERLFLDAVLRSKTLDIIDIGPLIGYNPEALEKEGGKGAIQLDAEKNPRVLPNAPLAIEGLERYDARVRYRADSIRAPDLPLEEVALDFTLDRRKLSLTPVAINLARGRAIGNIVIDARQQPVVTRYDIELRDMQMTSFLKSAGMGGGNTTGKLRGRIELTGEGATVRQSLATSDGRIAIIIPRGKLNLLAAELAKLDLGHAALTLLSGLTDKTTDINCGLIGFTVRDGIAKADPIIIDTETGKMTATGAVSFKDESLDLKFQGLSKEFSLISGQSPVYIGGRFAKPAINPISGELAARTGAAVALGVIATPFAALLAFIDPGDEEGAACGPLLQGLNAAAEKAAREARDKEKKAEKKEEKAKEKGKD